MTFFEPQISTLPPLENGDRLTRSEFEHRYRGMSDLKKAELIEGRVYMASPVRATKHSAPHAAIMTWLGNYWAVTPHIQLLDNPTVRLDEDNEPQPDACLRIEFAAGGRSVISDDDYVVGAPELIVEIAASTASYDLHEKKQVYRRNGVREYLVWRILDEAIDWFQLVNGVYVQLPSSADRTLQSQIFPGLWLLPADLLTGNLSTVLAGLQRGLASAEYLEFRNFLATREQRRPIE